MGLFAPNPITPIASTALEAAHILATSPGTLLGAVAQIDSTATTGVYYVQLIQGTKTVPSDGALPAGASFLVPPIAWSHTSGTPDVISIDPGAGGWRFAVGLVAVLSSTQLTKTGVAKGLFAAEVQ